MDNTTQNIRRKINSTILIQFIPAEDKENENRSSLATQAVIQRRRKPKRRSTGVVHIDVDVSFFIQLDILG